MSSRSYWLARLKKVIFEHKKGGETNYVLALFVQDIHKFQVRDIDAELAQALKNYIRSL